MLFTILLWAAPAVALLVFILFVVAEKKTWGRLESWDVFVGFMIGLGVGAAFFVMGLVGLKVASIFAPQTMFSQDQVVHQLQALSTGTDTDGRFYLLGGSIDSEPAFSYIREEGDAFVLRSVDADQSYVYQGDHEPHLVITTETWGNEFIFPWPESVTESYQFYVPDGSVANTFEVAP